MVDIQRFKDHGQEAALPRYDADRIDRLSEAEALETIKQAKTLCAQLWERIRKLRTADANELIAILREVDHG